MAPSAPDGRQTRRGLLRAAALGSGGVLAACAGGTGGGGATGGKSDRPVTLRWMSGRGPQDPLNTEAAPKLLALLKQKAPNLTVEVEGRTVGGTEFQTKMQTEWAAGTGADVAWHCCSFGVTFARAGLLQDLGPRLRKDIPQRVRDDFVPWLMEFFRSQEHGQWALPQYTGTVGLFYNKALFARRGVRPPDATWDWNSLREAALRLHDPDNGVFGRRQQRNQTITRVHQAGGHVVDPKDDRKTALDTPATLRALQYERDANLKDKVTGFEGDFQRTQGMTLPQATNAQRFAMWEEGSWSLAALANQVDKDTLAQIDVVPQAKGPGQRSTLATGDGWSIWKGTAAPDEAWELMKALQDEPWVEMQSSMAGLQPGRKSFQDKWVKLVVERYPVLAGKNLAAFTEGIQQSYARPDEFFRKPAESSALVSALYNEAIFSSETSAAIKNGEQALDAAVRDTVRRLNEINGS